MAAPGRKPLQRRPSGSALVFALCLAAGAMMRAENAAAAERTRTRLTVFDQVAVPGETTTVWVKLETYGLFRVDLLGERIRFQVDGKRIGVAMTNAEGVAALPYMPSRAACTAVIRAWFDGRENHAGSRDTAIVIDIDHTVADVSALRFALLPTASIRPLPGSPEIVRELAARYDIVFVSARDEHLRQRTLDWLAMKGFPRLPVIFRDMDEEPLRAARYKTGRLRELKRIWSHLAIGIGDRQTDADAYCANGLEAWIVPSEEITATDGVHIVERWDEIRTALLPEARRPRRPTPGP
jgi:hypothetical protein